MEHRWGNRVATDIDVRLFGCPASIGWGRLRDVSVTGGFIETRLSLQPLTVLRLTLPGKSRAVVAEARTVQAVVIRREPGGVGVEWLDAAPEVVEHLVREANERLSAESSRRRSASVRSPHHL